MGREGIWDRKKAVSGRSSGRSHSSSGEEGGELFCIEE